MIWFCILFFLVYCGLIIYLAIGFKKQKKFQCLNTVSQIQFSILIPFRNEEKHLPKLLSTIENLTYPKEFFEVFFINDDSTDNSVSIINTFIKKHNNCSLIFNNRTTNSPKKDAIVTALKQTTFNWIVTTDADCLLPKKWLNVLNDFIVAKKPNMVVAPVNYHTKNIFLEVFQLFDFMSLQGVTIGSFGNKIPFLCNGANLAYKKKLFEKVNGFKGNDIIASGDDIFLFEKFLNYNKNGVQYLKNKNAIVNTFPVNSWKKLIQQRIRWASKTGNVSLLRTKLIGLIIFLSNLVLLLNLFFAETTLQKTLIVVIKISIDLLLLFPTINFFGKQKRVWKYYLLSSLLYPFFSVSIVVLSLFVKYDWKGRTFKL